MQAMQHAASFGAPPASSPPGGFAFLSRNWMPAPLCRLRIQPIALEEATVAAWPVQVPSPTLQTRAYTVLVTFRRLYKMLKKLFGAKPAGPGGSRKQNPAPTADALAKLRDASRGGQE